MTRPRRILVTGSREWTDPAVIARAISGYLRSVGTSIGGAWPFPVIVHGGARGADQFADSIARGWGWAPEPHPVTDSGWRAPCHPECAPGHRRVGRNGRIYCPAAAHYRNQGMVDLGADVCLAFLSGPSRGTRDCVRRAEAAGIPVRLTNQAGEVTP